MQAKPTEIYIVDDDPGHARLIEKNLRRSGIGNAIVVFCSGAEVLEQIHGQDESKQPILMMLDLNMPGISGQGVLKTLKRDERTKHIPIIVLTTTDSAAEIEECYALGCNLFMTKPMQYQKFAENIRQLGLVFQIVEAPPIT